MPRRVSNPPNPWESTHVEYLGPPPEVAVEVYEESCRSLLSRNDSPDLPFTWSANPYRGCFHACAYCYARPSHQYLGFGAGTDFESRLVVKVNAPEVLRAELGRRTWRRETVVFSGNTDCYQPLEASYRLTRRCLEACLASGTPVSVITKGALVRRDAELLAELERRAGASVTVSIPFLEDEIGRKLEPAASSPAQRFASVTALAEAGVPTGVALSPIVPGLNDQDVPRLLERAAAAGARSAFFTLLRLPREVAPVFEERLRAAFPGRADRVLSALADAGGARPRRGAFGERMRGRGPRWQLVEELFSKTCRRLGLDAGGTGEGPRVPRPKGPAGGERQPSLFD